MDGIQIFCRGALAAVFLVSGTMKLRAPTEFADAVQALGRVPERWARWVGAAAIAAELGTAVALAVPVASRYGLWCALGLLTVFTALILRTLAASRGGAPNVSCACFGAGGAEISAVHLVRNAVLLTLAALGLATSSVNGTGGAGFGSGYQAPLALAFGLLLAVVTVLLDDLVYLFRRTAA